MDLDEMDKLVGQDERSPAPVVRSKTTTTLTKKSNLKQKDLLTLSPALKQPISPGLKPKKVPTAKRNNTSKSIPVPVQGARAPAKSPSTIATVQPQEHIDEKFEKLMATLNETEEPEKDQDLLDALGDQPLDLEFPSEKEEKRKFSMDIEPMQIEDHK